MDADDVQPNRISAAKAAAQAFARELPWCGVASSGPSETRSSTPGAAMAPNLLKKDHSKVDSRTTSMDVAMARC
jgi:hypothetical protein